MSQTEPFCPQPQTEPAFNRCTAVRAGLSETGLFASARHRVTNDIVPSTHTATSWRISPSPLILSQEQLTFFTQLGPQLLSFYRALNRLYHESVKGAQPTWVASWLDQGKPDALVNYSRMKRFRDSVPHVIRPDVIPTQDGMVITELDSVPGGIGLTAAMSRLYADLPAQHSTPSPLRAPRGLIDAGPLSEASTEPRYDLVGGRDGMVRGFGSMLRSVQKDLTGCVAIVVSEEAKDYRLEMTWLAAQLREQGSPVWCVEPRAIRFTEDGLRLSVNNSEHTIGLIYRFYELFDLLNIPKAELVQYAVKKEWVAVTPPYKPALEEKSAFALLHHPVLSPFWRKELGPDCFLHLTTIMPKTWLLDPSPIPPTATIPGLYAGERAVANWSGLETATQKERHFVIKPSGFSELAWGSRGVSIGHDLPQAEWVGALRNALASFPTTPYLLQEFHKGRLFEMDYLDEGTNRLTHMAGRARLSPYYFVTGEKVELAGILATICPADKKILHGMKDAIMVPCAVDRSSA
ncbi:MAG TPA: hypothetical protein VFX56_03540 [Nitrospira sp.]|nr:hypothetical protein [Nitrospira sp.]